MTPSTVTNQALSPSRENLDTTQPAIAQAGNLFFSGDGTDSLQTPGIGTDQQEPDEVLYEDFVGNV